MPCRTWCICRVRRPFRSSRLLSLISPPTINSFLPGGHMPNPINRQTELRCLLERLNLGGMAESFADLALRAAKESLSHEAYLYELATREEEQRDGRRTARLLRQSGLPQDKTFRTFHLARRSPAVQLQHEPLRSATFLETAITVIAMRSPGVEKSQALAAVGYELVLAGHPVLWTSTATLVQRLLAANRHLRLPHQLPTLNPFALTTLPQ